MKRVMSLIFAIVVALTLSMPAWSQTTTGAGNQSKAAATKAAKDKKAEEKAKKDAAKAKKKADKDAKKNATKK